MEQPYKIIAITGSPPGGGGKARGDGKMTDNAQPLTNL